MAYNDMYNTFWGCHIPYDFPYSFEEHNKIYLQGKQIPYWIWNEGDTTVINFDLEKLWKECPCYPELSLDDIDPSEYGLEIAFYNFRYEQLLKESIAFSKTPEFAITESISNDIFKSGVYYCSLTLVSLDDETVRETVRTILNKENCLIFVR